MKTKTKTFLSTAVVATVVGITSPAMAAVTVTDAGGFTKAITAGEDLIVIPENTEIVLTNQFPPITKTVSITGATNGTSIISGNELFGGFKVEKSATFSISGITLKKMNGKQLVKQTNHRQPTIVGGGALVNYGRAVIRHCHFEDNSVDANAITNFNVRACGGAIYSEDGAELLVENCSFQNNKAIGADGRYFDQPWSATDAEGGAIYINGSASIINCTFYGNQAAAGWGIGRAQEAAFAAGANARGGAVQCGSHAKVTVKFITGVENTVSAGKSKVNKSGKASGATIFVPDTANVIIDNSLFVANVNTNLHNVSGVLVGDKGNLFAAKRDAVQPAEICPKGTLVFPITKASPAYAAAIVDPSILMDQRGASRARAIVPDKKSPSDIGAYQLADYVVFVRDYARYYNTPNPTKFEYELSDPFGNVVHLPGAPQISTTANEKTPAGEYAINAALGSLDPNKHYKFVPGKLRIQKPHLVVRANNLTKLFNADNPVLGWSIKDQTGKDVVVEGKPEIVTDAKKDSPCGSYIVRIVGQGTLNPNYTYEFHDGALQIITQ